MKIALSEIPLRSSHSNAQTSFTSAETEIIELEIVKCLTKALLKRWHMNQMKLSQIFLQGRKKTALTGSY